MSPAVPEVCFEIRSPDGAVRRTGTVSNAASVTELPGQPGVPAFEVVAADLSAEPVRIRFTWPVDSAITLWRATQGSRRELPTDWASHRDIRSVRSAPVAAFVGLDDRSPLTISLSAAVRGCDFAVGVNEETAEQLIQLTIDDVEATPSPGAKGLGMLAAEAQSAGAQGGETADAPSAGAQGRDSAAGAGAKGAEVGAQGGVGAEAGAARGGAGGGVEGVGSGGDVRRFVVRVDLRGLHFAEALRGVADGWLVELGDRVAPVPELARQAMYSTWYSDHQHVSAEAVEHHARVSAQYGCRAVIVDDGWQTEDTARGYAHCGDWEPTSSTFPDMAEHVGRVHELGLDYVLWIAPPLIGAHSKAWDRLQDRTLGYVDGLSASVLDPRYREVRDHIVECCVRPVRDWGVDGLKIDFIDSWAWENAPSIPGGDCETVDEGVELILEAVTAELRRLRPSLLIEFRQDYVNPRLWQFGTFLRAGDCAMDAVENRVRTIDARLLAGDRAVHSDMLMWHPEAPVEAVARQFIGALFSTPQVSVELGNLSAEHDRVVRFWLDFCKGNAETLLHGVLTPSRPDARYTQVSASSEDCTVVAVFSNPVVRLTDSKQLLLLVNGGEEPRLIIEGASSGPVELVVSDCSGTELSRTTTTPPAGLWELQVPVGGVARIERV